MAFGDDIQVGQNPQTSVGMPVWARYELVLHVGPDDTIYALMSAAGDELDVRLLEIA